MRKKIIILICATLLTATLVTVAAVELSENITFNKMSKFDQMVTVLDENIEDNMEFNYVLINYKYLESGYNVSDENMEYIADLIIEGYNGTDVIKCAFFWLDTAEDVSIIKEMCTWKVKNSKDIDEELNFWVEDAFNAATNYKCGVLTIEDFDEYEEKGISDSDILIANRLCRKGVYTIKEIINKVQSGTELVDIAIEIEAKEPLSNHIEDVSVHSYDETEYPKVSVDELFESRQLSILQKTPELAYYDTTDETTDITTELDKAIEMIYESVSEELREGNYLRTKEAVSENE